MDLRPLAALLAVLAAAAAAPRARADALGLRYGFYDSTCPQAEDLVLQAVGAFLRANISLSGSLLRMHFHDCFVEGCDGSIMLVSRSCNGERDAFPNLTLGGFDEIEAIKAKLEEVCPLTVSCADIIAMAARDAIYLTGGSRYKVELGRRDGNVSVQGNVMNELPPPTTNITDLRTYFSQKGLYTKDIVVLSGTHTIGISHCSSFYDRLYNSTGRDYGQDPSLDSAYATMLDTVCGVGDEDNNTTTVYLDPVTPYKFDLNYYKNVLAGRALFDTDMALLDDALTRQYVERQANATSPDEFFADLASSMVNMGRVGVLTGDLGVIRSTCAAFVD